MLARKTCAKSRRQVHTRKGNDQSPCERASHVRIHAHAAFSQALTLLKMAARAGLNLPPELLPVLAQVQGPRLPENARG
jgi:hypothetical protein